MISGSPECPLHYYIASLRGAIGQRVRLLTERLVVRAHPGAFYFFFCLLQLITNITLQGETDFNFLLNVQTGPEAHQTMGPLSSRITEQQWWRQADGSSASSGAFKNDWSCMLLREQEQHYLYLYIYVYTTPGPCSLCTLHSNTFLIIFFWAAHFNIIILHK